MTHKLSDSDFHAALEALPLVSIDLYVVSSKLGQTKVLLGERLNRPAKGSWFVPGGRIRKGELHDAAMKRIVVDELRIDPALLAEKEFIGVFDHLYDDCVFGPETSTHYVNLAYMVRVDDGVVETINAAAEIGGQHSGWSWFGIDEALGSVVVHERVKETLQAFERQ